MRWRRDVLRALVISLYSRSVCASDVFFCARRVWVCCRVFCEKGVFMFKVWLMLRLFEKGGRSVIDFYDGGHVV